MNEPVADPIAPETTYIGNLTDSRTWRHFNARAGDVIVATPPKSGTTWTQGILALLFTGDPNVEANPSVNAPWFDVNFHDHEEVVERLDAQTHRRQIKTHTPLDGLPMWDALRYICVYRHPIDVHFSARKHVANYSEEVANDRLAVDKNHFPDDPRESFHIFLTTDAHEDHGTLKLIVRHYLECLRAEPRENLLRLHYADMTRDLSGQIKRIAAHVGVEHPPALMEKLAEAATFKSMKANADRFALAQGRGVWRNDAGFFDSATSNKWEGVLTQEDVAAYDAAISKLISPEERKWLEWGAL